MATSEPTDTGAGGLLGALPNGSQNPQFVIPSFSRLPFFGYANLSDQIQDAMNIYKQGAGAWAGNALPKYNGAATSTFGGGFAKMQPTVGGGLLGTTAYTGGPNPFLNGFDPFAGRGNTGIPPMNGNGNTPPPGNNVPPPGTNVPNPGTGAPNPPGGIAQPGLGGGSVPNNTSTVGAGVGGITGLLGGTASGPTTKAGIGAAQGGQPPYANTFEVPKNTQTIKTASGKEVPNPFGLSAEQIYWALSGHPDAARRLMESLGAAGGQTMQNGQLVMSPENQKFHQIMNYYEAGGGGFNGGGYTAEDAFKAAKSYAEGMGETTYNTQTWPKGLPIQDSSGKVIGYATGVGTNYTPV